MEYEQLQKVNNFEILFNNKYKIHFMGESDITHFDLNQAYLDVGNIIIYGSDQDEYPELNEKLNKPAKITYPLLEVLQAA